VYCTITLRLLRKTWSQCQSKTCYQSWFMAAFLLPNFICIMRQFVEIAIVLSTKELEILWNFHAICVTAVFAVFSLYFHVSESLKVKKFCSILLNIFQNGFNPLWWILSYKVHLSIIVRLCKAYILFLYKHTSECTIAYLC